MQPDGHAAAHWQAVYRDRPADRVSWYVPRLATSLRLLHGAGLAPGSRLIDVGGGASTLVDDVLALGAEVEVLDLADSALAVARGRLGARAASVQWWVGDVRDAPLPPSRYDYWHDRAVLHFLTDGDDAGRYVAQLRRVLKPQGHVLLAGFAPAGPERCSGLVVARRSVEELDALLGADFHRLATERETHRTPGGAEQAFLYALYRRVAA